MRLTILFTFLVVCLVAVYAAQTNQNNQNRRQLVKKKSANANVLASVNPKTNRHTVRVRKVKPVKSKKNVRRVVKKTVRKSAGRNTKKNVRKNVRGVTRRGSKKRLAKQEQADPNENKSLGAGQANGDLGIINKQSNGEDGSSAPAPAPAPASAPAPAPAPASPSVSSDLDNSAQGLPGKSSFTTGLNLPKSAGNNAVAAGFAQSSNGGSAFGAGFASISGNKNTAGGYGQVSGAAKNKNSESVDSPVENPDATSLDDSSDQVANYRRRPRHG